VIDSALLGDLAFVIAAYGLILGGVGLYAVTLARRLRRAERAEPRPGEPAAPDR
jgi:hypothetical protein